MPFVAADPEDRFWASIVVVENCWEWIKKTSKQNGYGHFKIGGKTLLAHRWAYERFVGPIPAGLTIDHTCRNRRCANPFHLEAVTPKENMRRGCSVPAMTRRTGFCQRGHAMVGHNVLTRPDCAKVTCRACRNAWLARNRPRLLEALRQYRFKYRAAKKARKQ